MNLTKLVNALILIFLLDFILGLGLVFSKARGQTTNLEGNDIEEAVRAATDLRKPNQSEDRTDNTWELAEGTVDIQGEAAAMSREAKKSWKKACDDWKVEFRHDNKENRIISMSCGSPQCAEESGSTICSSMATYKIKAKLN